MESVGSIERLIRAFTVLVEPLANAAEEEPTPVGIVRLSAKAGIDLNEILTDAGQLTGIANEISEIFDGLRSLTDLDNYPSPDEIQRYLQNIKSFVHVMSKLDNLQVRPESDPFLKEIGKRLLEYLLVRYLKENHVMVYRVFLLLGVITRGVEFRKPVKIDFQRLMDALSNPEIIMLDVYGWGTDQFDVYQLLDRLESVVCRLGFSASMFFPRAPDASSLGTDPYRDEPDQELHIYLLNQIDSQTAGRLGVSVLPLPSNDDPNNAGVAIVPLGMLDGTHTVDLGESWRLLISSAIDTSTSSYGIIIRPQEISLRQIADGNSLAEANFGISIRPDIASGERSFIFGSPTSARLEVGNIGLKFGINFAADKEFYIAAIIQNAAIVIDIEAADGFLRKILPQEPFESTFDITAGWSTKDGLYFEGSSSTSVSLPVHLKVGPVTIETISISLELEEQKPLEVITRAAIGAQLGPLSASVDGLGIAVELQFLENPDGNFGFIQLERPKLKPPNGAGLAIDAGAIAGGGYIEFDDPNKRYAGILQLQAGGIGLVAIGLITTRMPDGSDGFSLLINIGVQFMPPIQLPYGFTLSGVGGLLGYNRTMKTDALRDGLRNRALDSILFPEDPIANAPKIISDLRAVFPPEEDRFVIGPMVKLGWGTPKNIIHADIGIFIELPMPIRIALLGQIAATLPTPDQAIFELHIDVLGIIEFDKQLLSIDATIYDSRIYEYTLTGDAALRLSWGDNPVFATSLGGFHPRFSPPPNFPSLRRLTLNLSQGSAVQLYCKTYQALTSNSLQFGARVDLYASQSGATVEGNFTFDSLIYFSPFFFIAAMSGNVVAKYKGHKLSSVHLSLNLSGPTPWNARGKASFEILVWDVEVEFNKTWGPTQPITIEAVDPWPPLKDALEANDSWGSKLPDRNGMVEMLAEIKEEGASPPLVLHPAGFLEIRQNVLPLGIRLDKLGNAPVKDHYQFDIDSITIGSETFSRGAGNISDVEEDFAQGQFINLSDSEKLSRPSFEKMKAGVAASSDRLHFVNPVETILTYESILIQEDRTSKEAEHKDKAFLDWRVAKQQLFGNAARRSGLRTTGRRKFETLGKAKQVGVIKEGYTLVNNTDMSTIEITGNDGTIGQLQAEQLLNDYLQSNPEMAEEIAIVSSFEVAA